MHEKKVGFLLIFIFKDQLSLVALNIVDLSSCHAKNIDYINEIASQDSVERCNEVSKALEPRINTFVSLVYKVKFKDILMQSL